jgi:predicted O-methyltransferase YrrM
MRFLEALDKKDREDGTPRLQRLRQIPPDTGKFLSLIASSCPMGEFIEIGTSAGYSTMWLSLAMMGRHTKLKTYELLKPKIRQARETFAKAGIEDLVDLVEGDALLNLRSVENIAFCFLDCEKDLYEPCWDLLSGKMVQGGVLVADNAINHYDTIKHMIDKALADDRFDSLVVPIGKGELVCRRT